MCTESEAFLKYLLSLVSFFVQDLQQFLKVSLSILVTSLVTYLKLLPHFFFLTKTCTNY